MSRLIVISGLAVLAPAALASGTEGESGGNALITPEFGLIFWTSLTFLLLIFVLGRFAWRPLLTAIEARERSIQETLDQAREERENAQKMLTEHRDLVAQAKRERAEAVAAGQRDAERLKGEILEEGRRQREQLLQQTEAQIKAEMRQARQELRGVAADLSIRVAEKLMSKNLDDDSQRRLVEDYLQELEEMSGENRTVS